MKKRYFYRGRGCQVWQEIGILRQANYEKAQNLLLQLQQNMIESQSTIADPFNHTLLQTLKIDQLNISQEAQRQRQTRSGLDQNLAQLQQQLNLMSIQPPRSLLDASSTHQQKYERRHSMV